MQPGLIRRGHRGAEAFAEGEILLGVGRIGPSNRLELFDGGIVAIVARLCQQHLSLVERAAKILGHFDSVVRGRVRGIAPVSVPSATLVPLATVNAFSQGLYFSLWPLRLARSAVNHQQHGIAATLALNTDPLIDAGGRPIGPDGRGNGTNQEPACQNRERAASEKHVHSLIPLALFIFTGCRRQEIFGESAMRFKNLDSLVRLILLGLMLGVGFGIFGSGQ